MDVQHHDDLSRAIIQRGKTKNQKSNRIRSEESLLNQNLLNINILYQPNSTMNLQKYRRKDNM